MKSKYLIRTLFALLLLVLLLHPVANYFGTRYINHKLRDGVENYTGKIEALRLNLFFGEYHIYGLILHKHSNPTPPFLEIEDISFTLSLGALLKGQLRGTVHLENSEINVVDADSSEKSQSGLDGSGWLPTADALFPLDIENITFHDLDLNLEVSSVPKSFSVLSDLEGHISNITNVIAPNESHYAQINFHGNLGESGEVNFVGKIDFITPKHRFQIDSSITNPRLQEFNPLFKYYAGLDTKSGEIYLGINLQGGDEVIEGKIKPVLKNLDLLYKKDNYEGVWDVLKQHLAALGNIILTNPDTEQTATIIEFRKNRNEIKIESWEAFVTLLKNAFGEALPESIPQ